MEDEDYSPAGDVGDYVKRQEKCFSCISPSSEVKVLLVDVLPYLQKLSACWEGLSLWMDIFAIQLFLWLTTKNSWWLLPSE